MRVRELFFDVADFAWIHLQLGVVLVAFALSLVLFVCLLTLCWKNRDVIVEIFKETL